MTQIHLQSDDSENSLVSVSSAATRDEPQEQEQSQTVLDLPAEQSAEWEALLAALQQEQKQRKQWNSLLVYIYLVSLLVIIGIGLARIVGIEVLSHYYISITYLYWGAMWLGPIFFSKKAARKLAQLNDLHCVGPLVEVWGGLGGLGYDRKTRRLAERALTRLLPRLKASDAELLNEKQRAILRSALAMNGYSHYGIYYNTDFLIAILKTFEQIGDWHCEPHVRKMAETAKDKRVQQAAQECLPYLETLAAKGRVGENLLRPSDKIASGPDVLLRPATGAIEASPQQLLHPVDNATEQAHAE